MQSLNSAIDFASREGVSMPGVVCGIAVSDSRVVGVRSAHESAACGAYLPEPEFFSVPREGGPIKAWAMPDPTPYGVIDVTTWGDFAAVLGAIDADVPPSELFSVRVVRMTDGAMRRFVPSEADSDFGSGDVALDDQHLYISENPPTYEWMHRIVRYRLDHFDTIGLPLEGTPSEPIAR